MSKKAPGMFRRPYPEKKFNKKLLAHIEQPDDREFLVSCFDLRDGVYTLKQEYQRLEKSTGEENAFVEGVKTVKRLAGLEKAIKINRRWSVKLLPLTASGLLIAGLVFFFTVMMNPLLEGLLERGLENIFEAKCDVRGFHLGLLRFRIRMNSITAADRDEPMTNLFETGRIELRLKPQAVLRGKVYIEELRADHLRFGTPRTSSGALPRYAAKIAARRNKAPDPPLVDLAKFDAMGLLNQEYDKLVSPKAFQEALAAYETSKSRWESQYGTANQKVEDLTAAVRPLINFNVNDIKTPEDGMKLLADINTMTGAVESARNEVYTIVDGVQADVRTAQNLEKTAREAIQEDMNHLKSYLDLGSGSAFKALEPVIWEMLSGRARNYIIYGERALEALNKIKALQAKIPKSEPKPKKETFKGRSVLFPTPGYPVFYLGEMASDFTLGGWNWGFSLRSVSSDPDISNRPTELDLSLREESGYRRSALFSGRADFRTNASEYFNAGLAANNFPLDIRGDLRAAGIGGFSGTAGFTANLSGGRGGAVSGGGGVDINEPRLADPSGTIAEVIQEVLEDRNNVNLAVQYEHSAGGNDSFTLTTNIGDLIMAALRRAVERYLKQAEEAIEKALRQKLSEYLDEKWVSREELDMIFAAVKGDKSAVDKLKTSLDDKKTEAEKKMREAAEKVKTEAEEAGKRAIQNIAPNIRLPF